MSSQVPLSRWIVTSFATLSVACGGGGGDDGPTEPAPPGGSEPEVSSIGATRDFEARAEDAKGHLGNGSTGDALEPVSIPDPDDVGG